MKQTVCKFMCICIVLLMATPCIAGKKTYDSALAKDVTTRYGQVEVSDDPDDLNKKLLFNGKEIFSGEAYSLDLSELSSMKSRDYVLIFLNSGGTACYGEFALLEIQSKDSFRLSDKFGTCSDLYRVKIEGEKLFVEMPGYVPNPDLLSKKEIKNIENAVIVFEWLDGKMVEKKEAQKKKK